MLIIFHLSKRYRELSLVFSVLFRLLKEVCTWQETLCFFKVIVLERKGKSSLDHPQHCPLTHQGPYWASMKEQDCHLWGPGAQGGHQKQKYNFLGAKYVCNGWWSVTQITMGQSMKDTWFLSDSPSAWTGAPETCFCGSRLTIVEPSRWTSNQINLWRSWTGIGSFEQTSGQFWRGIKKITEYYCPSRCAAISDFRDVPTIYIHFIFFLGSSARIRHPSSV